MNANRPSLDPDAPHTFKRRILVGVTGLSPQVVTETLYALATRGEHAFIPTEIHLITTVEGAKRARLALFSEDPGWFHKLLRDYGLAPIHADAVNIHVARTPSGTDLDDIRTPEDNVQVANLITETVRTLTADPASALHVSIAGGRKTMGFYLGYALSLFGRTQDRLSHVLVSEPFESSWDFFYPTPYSRVLATRDNKLADTRDAQVTLAEIPFVSLRHGLGETQFDGQVSFSQAVAAARATIGPPELTLDLTAGRIRAAGLIVELPPTELAFLAWFARRTRHGHAPLNCPKDGVPEPSYADEYCRELRDIVRFAGDTDKTMKALKEGMDKTYFEQKLSKLARSLKTALGAQASPYLVEGSRAGGSPRRLFALRLPPAAIQFAALSPDPKSRDPHAG